MSRISVSAHITQWFTQWYLYRYQPISHSVQWFSLWDVYRYHPISPSVQWFSLRNVYGYQPISHSFQWSSQWDHDVSVWTYVTLCVVFLTESYIGIRHYEIYIGISLYHPLRSASVFIMRRISVSAYITYAVVFTRRRISNLTSIHLSQP